jgi:hypothetical protein
MHQAITIAPFPAPSTIQNTPLRLNRLAKEPIERSDEAPRQICKCIHQPIQIVLVLYLQNLPQRCLYRDDIHNDLADAERHLFNARRKLPKTQEKWLIKIIG